MLSYQMLYLVYTDALSYSTTPHIILHLQVKKNAQSAYNSRPCMSLRIANVIKMLITSSRIVASNTWNGDSTS